MLLGTIGPKVFSAGFTFANKSYISAGKFHRFIWQNRFIYYDSDLLKISRADLLDSSSIDFRFEEVEVQSYVWFHSLFFLSETWPRLLDL